MAQQRTELIRQRATVADRIRKAFENANIKLASVASDVLGASGQDMIRGWIGGEDDPVELAEMARQELWEKIPPCHKPCTAGRPSLIDSYCHPTWIRAAISTRR